MNLHTLLYRPITRKPSLVGEILLVLGTLAVCTGLWLIGVILSLSF